MELEKQLEAILFYKGEPIKVKELSAILRADETSVREAAERLRASLSGRGVCLLQKDDAYLLGTAPDLSELIENVRKEELSRDIGKAGLETLSIILYKGPVSRSDVDYIRGVNSSFIIRNLLIRGLVERITNPNDSRSFLYKPTFELLSYLGITRIEELPDLEQVRQELEVFVKEQEEMGKSEEPAHENS